MKYKKALLSFGLALAGLIGVVYAASSTILLHSLKKAEEQETRQMVQGVLSFFSQSEDEFSYRFTDWSAWDDAYTFIKDGNQAYVKANLVPEVLANLNVNLVLYINSSGRIVYGTGFDLKSKKKTSIPQALQKYLSLNDILLHHPNPQSNLAGIVLLPKGPMIVTSQPIVKSTGEGPIRGTLIYGRYLDGSRIQKLIKLNHEFSLTIHGLNEAKLPPDFQTVRSSLSKKEPILIRRLSKQTIAGYSLLMDIYGKPALLFRLDVPRKIYH